MKPSSTTRPTTRQTGYALILMVVALMGVGGVVIAGFTQGAKQDTEHERYLHNQRILREAKQALLQYAYNYPQMGPGQDDGPGRLLCPDTDNDGFENYEVDCIDHDPDPDVPMVGRFPWRDTGLNFHEAKDASGEHLWYAVSNSFARGLGSLVNSDTAGSITIQDRSGALLYDGSVNGVAAVIIAPGPQIERSDGAMQVRGTVDEKKDVINYLDIFGALDNANFVNGTADGFVTGPIFNPVDGSLTVNDQMIVITAAEVIAMAEKATLQAYRKAINDYLSKTVGVYPWLYNYDGIDYDTGAGESVDVAIDKLSSFFPSDAVFATEKATYLGIDTSGNDGIFGRIPSMFVPYFSDIDSQSIESKIGVEILNADFMGGITYNRTFPSPTAGTYTFVNTIWNGDLTNDGPADMNMNVETNEPVTGLRFDDDGDSSDNQVKLIGSIAADETYTLGDPIWFWSRNDLGLTEWAKCRTNHIVDCHVDAGYIPDPHNPGQRSIQILRVEVELTFDSGFADLVEFTFDVSGLPGAPANPVIAPADVNGHAQISATFSAAEMPGPLVQISYQWDGTYTTDGDWNIEESGTLDFSSMVGPTLELGLRFYPELPGWALDNEWHNSIRMAYAFEYAPPGTGPCTVDTTCLQLNDSPGKPWDKASLLVIAGTHKWVDVDVNGRLKNDRDTVFDNGINGANHDDNPRFYRHEGNDKILVIDEL
jgi:hypothetical protein